MRHIRYGPEWYGPLWLGNFGTGTTMKNGYSRTKGGRWDIGKYEVLRLPDGKNPLTGSTHEYKFTCVELEVFAL